MNLYIQLSTNDESQLVSIFRCEQDLEKYLEYKEIVMN